MFDVYVANRLHEINKMNGLKFMAKQILTAYILVNYNRMKYGQELLILSY